MQGEDLAQNRQRATMSCPLLSLPPWLPRCLSSPAVQKVTLSRKLKESQAISPCRSLCLRGGLQKGTVSRSLKQWLIKTIAGSLYICTHMPVCVYMGEENGSQRDAHRAAGSQTGMAERASGTSGGGRAAQRSSMQVGNTACLGKPSSWSYCTGDSLSSAFG